MRGTFYIICYDTPSDRRRRKLHKLLKNYAVAVQKSVFETFLDGPLFDKLLKKICSLMDEAVDSVRIYGLSKTTQKRMKVIGYPGKLEDPDHFFIKDNDLSSNETNPFREGFEEDADLPDWL